MTQIERNALVSMQDLASYGIGSILSGGGSAPSPNTPATWVSMYDNFQSIALQSNHSIPLIYGIDAVHGHNNVYGAVIMPHNIGMGCTWNPALIQDACEVVAREVAATGIDWTFAPCIAVPRNEQWGRTYEGFGETPEVQKVMAEASVLGFQGTDLSDNETIVACAKHFVGDGATTNGIDQGNAEVSESELRNIHMEGYIDAINAEVGTVMASYNSWNGLKLHGHSYLLTDVLKNELGFEGFVISDWQGVDQVDGDYRTAIKKSINAGVDMVMVPFQYEVFINHLISLVQDGEVSMDRIDDAVRRILKQKYLLNLFNEPFADPSLASQIGTQNHRDVARQVVRESLVLLNAKNDILPLQKNGQNILVAGELADDLGAQCGGWTISWQGDNGDITPGTTILQGLQDAVGNSTITYSSDGTISGNPDVAVVVVGEKTPYAESGGDTNDLNIEESDINLIKTIKEAGIPVVALLVSGRPMILSEPLAYTDAMMAVWYPGTEGDGIAEVLFGDFLPKGQLTHTWPATMEQVPINVGDADYDPLFAYQHGLQNFPAAAQSSEMSPYAATTSRDGQAIILAVSDGIEMMNATADDFDVIIYGNILNDAISSIDQATYDSSILIFNMNNTVLPGVDVRLNYSGGNISGNGLVLEDFTYFYVHNAVGNASLIHPIPGRIEAEDFASMEGIQVEPCTEGGENVGYIEAGDWMKYNVEVNQTGLYKMTARLAGMEGGNLLLTFNDTIPFYMGYDATFGWQTWENFEREMVLDAGLYEMQLHALNDGFNINYFDFEYLNPVNTNLPDQTIDKISVFPNPVSDILNLEFYNNKSKNATIRLLDVTGRKMIVLYEGEIKHGENTHSFDLNLNWPEGYYFVEIQDEERRYFEKIFMGK